MLLGTDPANGAVLATVPAEVSLTFNEPVTVRPGGVRLLDAAGEELSTDSRSVDTTVVLTVPPDLASGTYIVAFRVISADSHPVSGGFSFAVGAPSSAAVALPESSPSRALDLLRQTAEAVAYLGLLVGAGLLVFLLVLLRAEAPILRRRLLRLAGWSAGLTVLARLVLVPAVPAWQDGGELTGLIDGAQWLTGLRSEEALSSVLVVLGLGVALWATAAAGAPAIQQPATAAAGMREARQSSRRRRTWGPPSPAADRLDPPCWPLSRSPVSPSPGERSPWSGIPAPTVRPGWSFRPTSCTSAPPGCGWAGWWHCLGL
ncbi:copper resistance CopC family protein [Verrucosispora sioxanthis]|uniref:copper resistance CopC family protein n=1 Tax=Verrucosispora sioxanthis TaxID=2499994 RepID=UPI001C10A347|nr:copper resistance CopC family protein [Verrucosispora sioxanthis]